jgi:hypothetical protein
VPVGVRALNLVFDGAQLFNNNSTVTLDANRTVELKSGGGFIRAGWGFDFTVNGQITGPGGLGIVWDGSPVVFTNPANDYAGNTTIGTPGNGAWTDPVNSHAMLRIGVDNALPFGAVSPGGPSRGNLVFGVFTGVNAKAAATLDLNGHNLQVNGLSGAGTNGVIDNQFDPALVPPGTYTLTVGYAGQPATDTATFGGNIRNTVGIVALTSSA